MMLLADYCIINKQKHIKILTKERLYPHCIIVVRNGGGGGAKKAKTSKNEKKILVFSQYFHDIDQMDVFISKGTMCIET